VFVSLLPLRDVGQNLAQSLVLDNRSLIDLLQLVENLVGQVTAFVLDRKPPVGIVDHGDALAGEGAMAIRISGRGSSRERRFRLPCRMANADNDNFLGRRFIEDQKGVGWRYDPAQAAFAGELAGVGILHQKVVIACMRA
jgi:hypothetical protein